MGRRLLSIVSVVLGIYATADAQPADRDSAWFRIDANLILIPVTVTDARGSNISGLGKDSFTILDNRQPQPIAAFFAEDSPASIGIVLDVSGSVKDTLNREKAAAHAILQLSNPEDDFFFVTVSSNPGILTGPVEDASKIEEFVRSQTAGGGTALDDTLYYALNQLRSRPRARRALVVISDGMDNHSRYANSDVMRLAVESDTQVYTIAIDRPRANVKGVMLAEIQRGLAFMDDLAEKTGGLSVRLGESANPSTAANRISSAIRNQYVIGYHSPDSGRSEKWHRIQVKVNLSRVNVYARSGYQSR
ncbi:MAG: VWA domain-containing protein [Acidobacteriia bacterium]|nr:VWA domain-containing protein [Terriglobia bacterium]